MLAAILNTQPKVAELVYDGASREDVVHRLAVELLASLPASFVQTETKDAIWTRLGGPQPLNMLLTQEISRLQVHP